MTKKLTHLNSKTLTTLFGCVVVLCALIQSDVHADEIEIKTSQFDEILDDIDAEIGGNNDSQLAEKIRKQRAAFNAQSAKNSVATSTKAAMASGKNECDQKLRACMKSKCGDDYLKCAGDTDTMWGSKMDTCRLDITCTGEEYRLHKNGGITDNKEETFKNILLTKDVIYSSFNTWMFFNSLWW